MNIQIWVHVPKHLGGYPHHVRSNAIGLFLRKSLVSTVTVSHTIVPGPIQAPGRIGPVMIGDLGRELCGEAT